MTCSARVDVVHRVHIVKHYLVKYVQYGPMNVILTLMLHVLRGTPQYVQQDDREQTPDLGGRLAGRGC